MNVYDVFITPSGTVALATDYGVSVRTGSVWTDYDADDGLPQSPYDFERRAPVEDVYLDNNGVVFRLADGILSSIGRYPGPGNVLELSIDAGGTVYAAAYNLFSNNGLWNRFSIIVKNDYFDSIICVVAVSPAKIAAGSNAHGVAVYDGVSWTNYSREEGLVSSCVYDVILYPDDTLHVATAKYVSLMVSKKPGKTPMLP